MIDIKLKEILIKKVYSMFFGDGHMSLLEQRR